MSKHYPSVIKACLNCENEFMVQPSRLKDGRGKYCSYECRNDSYTKRPIEKHPRWKGGASIDVYGYKKIKKPDHPNSDSNGYILEHRFIMESKIGRHLNSWEIVHHINGDKLDNRIENLEILSRSEHSKLHYYSGGYKI